MPALPETVPSDAGGFDPRHFAALVEAEDRHFWFRVRNRVIAAALRPIIADLPVGYRVLEVGCGTGNVLRVLERECTEGSVVGIELFGEGVDIARSRVRCPVLVGDLRDQHFDTPFDIVGMFDVLEHIDDDLDALRGVRELLTPRGRIMLTVPAHPRLWSDFDVASHHHRRYTRSTLSAVLDRAGFRTEYLSPFMSLLYPLMRLRRQAHARADVDPSAVIEHEFTANPVGNALARWALMPEALVVGRGWRLPMGTSLLAVARRHGA